MNKNQKQVIRFDKNESVFYTKSEELIDGSSPLETDFWIRKVDFYKE